MLFYDNMMAKKGFVKVASRNDLKEGGLLRVEPEGKPIVLSMVEGKVYAMDATCTHQGGPLDEGKLEGHDLTCPWHYAVFDVRNGRVSDKTVWATDLNSYPVQMGENGDISINLQERARAEETVQKRSKEEEARAMGEGQKKFYEEEERKTPDKLTLELISKEKLEQTDIMTFRIARGGLEYAAGQFAYFKLDGVSGDPKGPIRHFSIASSPTEQDLLISTRIRDTPYKQKLASLENGTKIMSWGPEGEFVLHDDHSKPAVFLSGGIGVTPFRSMIKYATDKQMPLKIVMFDSNRNEQNILYKHEFDGWSAKNKNVKILYTVTDEKSPGWTGEKGRIDRAMIARHVEKSDLDNAIFYVCGPPGMLKAMKELLQNELQILKERIKVEEFTGY
jgi:ferredoxin-NADP reductase/nitrite reductase/ring-hydroxylating ferredoxin subunit